MVKIHLTSHKTRIVVYSTLSQDECSMDPNLESDAKPCYDDDFNSNNYTSF